MVAGRNSRQLLDEGSSVKTGTGTAEENKGLYFIFCENKRSNVSKVEPDPPTHTHRHP